MERHSVRVAVALFVEKDGKILFIRRKNTGHRDGVLSLPAGHLEHDETIHDAAIREAREETGIEVVKMTLVHTTHAVFPKENFDYLWLYFHVPAFNGTITNCEPEKCEALEWHDPDEVQDEITEYVYSAYRSWKDGEMSSVMYIEA